VVAKHRNESAPAAGVADVSKQGVAGGRAGVYLRYEFGPGEQDGASLGNPLFELLEAVTAGGSISHAARRLGTSYRHVWGSLRKWEGVLGEPLVIWSQGQKARLTQFAQKLMWAELGARTRMQPHIEALRWDLARVLAEARDPDFRLLTLRASHDIALTLLQQHLATEAGLHLNIGFQGSVDALKALNDRQCMVAGFHVAVLPAGDPVFAAALKPWLKPRSHRLIACSRRVQGLMVRREHAGVRDLADVARLGLRFVHRQAGAGTRMLVDHLLAQGRLAPEALRGGREEHVEHTHVAVALCVAGGMADAGVGVEAAALQFGLHFVPLAQENYFLACHAENIDHPDVAGLRAALAGRRWRELLENLPGYRSAEDPGSVLAVERALPWWRRARKP